MSDAGKPSGRTALTNKLGTWLSLAIVGVIVITFGLGIASEALPREFGEWLTDNIVTVMGLAIAAIITIAGAVGGFMVARWVGLSAGIVLGTGFALLVFGIVGSAPSVSIAGGVTIGLGVAGFYAGGRLYSTLPPGVASAAASGAFLVAGLANCLVAYFADQPQLWAAGIIVGGAGAGYLIAELIVRGRRAAQHPTTTAPLPGGNDAA